jgi:uncharacterized protein (DUF952 family)
VIAHITSRGAWQRARLAGEYTAPSLATQGFIHCSAPTEAQLIAVANAVYAGQPDLALLLIDPERLTARLEYEEFETSGLSFSHVYGPINLPAVVQVVDFPARPDSTFALPPLG